MKRTITLIVLAILVIGGTAYYKRAKAPVNQGSEMQKYQNAQYGFSFEYPKGYVLTEKERGTSANPHYFIVLFRQEDSVIPVNGEGPVAITVDIYPHTSQNLLEWVKTDPRSNFDPSRIYDASGRLSGLLMVNYTWSGLYEGKSVVVKKGDSIIVFTGTHLNPDDVIVKDFEKVLNSVKF